MAENAELRVGNPTRRQFVQAGVGLSAAGLATVGAVEKLMAAENKPLGRAPKSIIKPGDTILFQGDSITDAGRKREIAEANSAPGLGEGYVWLTASQLLVDSPSANLKIYNRGISGQKVFELANRWQADCFDLKPNVLSILIGVNDYWHFKKFGYKGTLETYEKDYAALVKRTKDALPDVQLVICEPFLLECGSVEAEWPEQFAPYRAAARRIAVEAKAIFVPFQTMFDFAVKVAPPATWAADGVHPTSSGAALMAHWWLRAVGG